ncbi:MAG: polysaccharide deacetylase family protein [Chthoniobacterales bacterium]
MPPPRSSKRLLTLFLFFPVLASLLTAYSQCAEDTTSQPNIAMATTRILKWRDDKKAVFLLCFDDSAPSAVKLVVPELKKRKITGTFYINPGNGPYKSLKSDWETTVPGPGIEYANHTFTHVGATSAVQLDQELAPCNDEINKCYPDRNPKRLISFGRPGGVPWTVSPAETEAALKKYSLIERPPFIGYPFQIKTQEQMLSYVDKTLASGEMEQLVFHGVGGDWLVTPFEMFTSLLDKLEEHSSELWLTDPISWHQYLTERKLSEIKILGSTSSQIKLQLVSDFDTNLYDLPLSLSTAVPKAWKSCSIQQGSLKATYPVIDGQVFYQATPGKGEIIIEPAGA